MPLYSYYCEACDHTFDEMARVVQYQDPQPCPLCGGSAPRVVGNRFPGFILTGDGWISKNERIRGQMRRKNERLATREREMRGDGTLPTLQPNVGGERTRSWADAAKLAKEKGKDASGYERLAREKDKSA
jgi:putative FmdB family regulatory protein